MLLSKGIKSLNSRFAFFSLEEVGLARRSEERSGLPSFFQDNPWLDILAQRGTEPSPDFVVSQASPTPVVSRTTPSIEPETITSSPVTPPAISFPREFVVRLEMPSELIKAIRELKEVVVMALSMSQRQATIVPIYIPINVAQLAPQATHALIPTRGLEGNGLICPKCGRPGKLIKVRKGKRTYFLVLHRRQKCYLGPEEKIREKWPQLLERSLVESAQRLWSLRLSQEGLWALIRCLTAYQTQDSSSFLVRGVGFEPTQAYATGASGPPL
mgnify:CR=1 FL=1